MATLSLEERVTALEAGMEEFKHQQEPDKQSVAPQGWKRLVGAFQGMPGFEEGVEYGRQWRASQPVLNAEEEA